MEIVNSTISGNTAASNAGGILNLGTLGLNNVTITNNTASAGEGGGIFDGGGTTTMSNTILAGNFDTDDQNSPDCTGTIISAGFNLVGNSNGCTFSAADNDQVGTNLSPIDPMLGDLGDNGGTTETHLPQEGSPAIDAGNPTLTATPTPTPTPTPSPTPTPTPTPMSAVEPSQAGNAPQCEATDQRGEPRPSGTACDIGAVEVQQGEGGGGGDGGCSIAGESISAGTVAVSALIPLIPAFAAGFRMLRRRGRKNEK